MTLGSCAVENRNVPTANAAPRVTANWYEVVSAEPGPQVTDAAMRSKIEASGQPWKVRDLATGIEMVLVMPGEFLMGSPESEPDRNADEGPQHRVQLTRAFYLGATEVTQLQWRRTMGEFQGFFQDDSKPADGSWDDLQAFLSNANALSNASAGLPADAERMRAPTEAEWEYACRAGTTGPFSFEGPATHDVLNFNDGDVESPYIDGELKVVDGRLEVIWKTPPSPGCRMSTAPAGSLPPNAWGLHEMHGNLVEWTADKYSPEAYEARGPLAVDPVQRAVGSETHTLRGGDWYTSAHHSRSAVRDEGGPQTRSNRIGFRVARTLHAQDDSAAVTTHPRLRYEHGVRAIFEDSGGNFWFGTWKEGVCRFDGEALTYFTEADGLDRNQVRTVIEDRDGILWFDTGDGICSYDGKRITTHTDQAYRSKDQWQLAPGDLWFGEDDGRVKNEREGEPGVYRYDGETLSFLAFPLPEDRAGDWEFKFTGMAHGQEGRVWFATYGSVIGYDGNTFTFMNNQSGGFDGSVPTDLHVRSIFEDSQGRLWIGNNGIGVLLQEGDTTINFTQKHGLGSTENRRGGPLPGDASEGSPSLDRVFAIGEDSAGHIWFGLQGTQGYGAWRYDGQSLRNFTERDGLTSKHISAIYRDKRGDLWLGGDGVFKFNGESFDRIH